MLTGGVSGLYAHAPASCKVKGDRLEKEVFPVGLDKTVLNASLRA
jgi:hypothetical protein